MATFGELRAEMNRLLRQTANGALDVDINDAINDAIRYHEDRAFDFNEDFTTINTVDGQPDYAIPDGVGRINEAQLFWGGQNYTVLVKRNWRWYLQVSQDANALRAVPSTYYTVNRNRIFLYPTPSSQPNRIELFYNVDVPDLVQDDDTNIWLENARLLIRSQALYYVYLHRLQQRDHADAQLRTVRTEMNRLYRRANGRIGADTLTPYTF